MDRRLKAFAIGAFTKFSFIVPSSRASSPKGHMSNTNSEGLNFIGCPPHFQALDPHRPSPDSSNATADDKPTTALEDAQAINAVHSDQDPPKTKLDGDDNVH